MKRKSTETSLDKSSISALIRFKLYGGSILAIVHYLEAYTATAC